MTQIIITLALLSYCTNFILANTGCDPLRVKSYTLSNGLTVWLNEDHSQPKVFGAVVVKAGAKDTPNTGIAHYFEHIMFKGTDKIGTINYEKERVLLDSISLCYDQLAQTTNAKERARIQQEINKLSIRAADYVIPNEFNRLISRYGGTRLNASTSYDYTVYFNSFSPQYIAHWAELNSERLINPVFRMFQTELETVYEEKNMYSDVIMRVAIDSLMARFFHPHPYAYPIIGSTEHLKNPRLSDMRTFFEQYYVASNMGVILSGDFDTESVLPILETTFSRIKKGDTPARKVYNIPPFFGEERFQLRFPIPIVTGAGYAFRGVPSNHPDQPALNIVTGLLNNSNGTGYFDKLMVNRKLYAAMTMNESFNEAGIIAIFTVPKPVFQSVASACYRIRRELERVKTGDFSDEIFSSLKLEQKRKYASRLEEINSRSQMMIDIFSQGKSWEEHIKEIDRINELTKDDIINVARKYFADDYLYVTKKTGKYPKDNLPKPNYLPVVPKNVDASSAYAATLEALPVTNVQPRFLDFQKDVRIIPLTPFTKLYASPNPVNNIFTLDISFGAGKIERPELVQLTSYLPLLGTEQLTFDEFRGRLQTLGSTLNFEVDNNRFLIKITGFDENFSETIALVSSFMQHAKPEEKKLKLLADEEKLMKKTFYKSTESLAQALLEKVRYGEKSIYKNKLNLKDIKNLRGQDLLDAFHSLQKIACDLHYCGTLPIDSIASHLRQSIRLADVNLPAQSPAYRPMLDYEAPCVYFCDAPDAAQSIIYSYVKGEAPRSKEQYRHAARLFSAYFGGDMSSLMFQEIREFRSFAYTAQGRYSMLPLNFKDKPGALTTILSTQNDKATDALAVLDSLIRNMPVRPERLPAVKQSLINQMSYNYPAFRTIPGRVASMQNEGYTADPNISMMERLPQMTMDDVADFYAENIKGKNIVHIIVGNSKKINMQKLATFGAVVKIKKEDLYN
ncbi:MAG: insulinase family protein [Tannerellaceae bacterium]|jgi:predicted Zn-dependent peptidase|nr:insulinase family protein [Tannerellaceae bacterium]